MPKYAITPWRAQGDLLRVRQQLYGHNEDRRYAVDRVMAWKLRGNLPHAVESTALLTDAILHHKIESNSIFSVRAVYSAAFARFVTGFCDIGRNKERSLEPSSMLDIAKQIGMPPEFVALRHEATHEELPAIQRLMKATDEALKWLWEVYWSRLESPESDEVVAAAIPQISAEARELFKNWRSARREALRAKKQRQDEEVQAAGSSCIALMDGAAARANAVADVLAKDRMLLPSKRELGTSLDGAYLIWDPLLQAVISEKRTFLTSLVKSLLEALNLTGSSKDVDGEGLYLWLDHLLDFAPSSQEKDTLRREIVTSCCLHPGHWTHRLGLRMLETGSAEFKANWQDVLEASRLQERQADVSGDVIIEDGSDDVLNGGSQGTFEKPSRSNVVVNSWVRAAAVPNTPIGVVG